MRYLLEHFINWMDDLKIKTKLQGLYLFCVLLPLILTDTVVLHYLIHSEQSQELHEMENIASAVQYNLSSMVEDSATTAKNIYMNQYINDFLDVQYPKALDYVVGYQEFMKNSFFKSSMGTDSTKVTVYADNETIVNGGVFSSLSAVRETKWYQKLSQSDQDIMLLFYYDDWQSPAVEAKRKILFLRKLNFVSNRGCEKVVKMEMNYGSMVRNLNSMNYQAPVYICQNGKIMLSNEASNNIGEPFESFTSYKKVGFEKDITLYGQELKIYILKNKSNVLSMVWNNMPVISSLLIFNILLPWIMMSQIERSITSRIRELGLAFDSVNKDRLKKIPAVRGKDEIGTLMSNYNRMAGRTNELIQTVYKDKLREQEMNIARQNAELLALHSQINPHFLFNALESIRMHSILKQEFETADMVEKLAVMERQNVDWDTDMIEIKREMEFVRAYLGLQKYRFGERLSFELDVEKPCEKIRIPKLTIVTFVENACVHGIESKTAPGWIFVRVYMENTDLCIEVEDTGEGMSAQLVADVRDKMQNASIDRLQAKGRVGILNACLRINMISQGKASFSVESEEGVGTMILIRIKQ